MSEKLEAKDMPLVTSLSDSDTILAVGADGNGKRIAGSNAGKYRSSLGLGSGAKWIRVLTFKDSCAGIFSLRNNWNTKNPSVLLLAFSHSSALYNAPEFDIVRMIVGDNRVFDKARVVYKPNVGVNSASDVYLEIHQYASSETTYFLEMRDTYGAVPGIALGNIPDGYLAKEFDLTESLNRGGGKSLHLLCRMAERRVA